MYRKHCPHPDLTRAEALRSDHALSQEAQDGESSQLTPETDTVVSVRSTYGDFVQLILTSSTDDCRTVYLHSSCAISSICSG